MKQICVFLLVFFYGMLQGTSQVGLLSEVTARTDTGAMYKAMHSDLDTIVVDDRGKPWLFGPMRFEGIRDKTLLIEKGVQILAMPDAFPNTGDALWTFVNCTGMVIQGNGATLGMNKEEYTDGEWRHALSIRGCSNFRIEDITLENSGGDGIYIAGTERGTWSDSISIKNVRSLRNKRQGISIISARNVWVEDSEFSHTAGTLPGAGLDIEPNNEADIISNIHFTDCTFRENYHAGIQLGLGKLRGSSEPISIRFSRCILENNHVPEHPRAAAEILIFADKLDPVSGEIVFEDCLVRNSKWGILYSRKPATGFTVLFDKLVGENILQSGAMSAIGLETLDYYQKTPAVGGYRFKNVFLSYPGGKPVITVRGSRMHSHMVLEDVHGHFTLGQPVDKTVQYINYNPDRNKNVELRFNYN